MEIKYHYFDESIKDYYGFPKGGVVSKSFSSISEVVDFIKENPNKDLDRITVEKDGETKALVVSRYLGDEKFEYLGIPSLNQEDSNKYRPYFEDYKIVDYTPEFLELTSVYINKNIAAKIENDGYKAMYELKKPTQDAIANLRERFKDTQENVSNKPNM